MQSPMAEMGPALVVLMFPSGNISILELKFRKIVDGIINAMRLGISISMLNPRTIHQQYQYPTAHLCSEWKRCSLVFPAPRLHINISWTLPKFCQYPSTILHYPMPQEPLISQQPSMISSSYYYFLVIDAHGSTVSLIDQQIFCLMKVTSFHHETFHLPHSSSRKFDTCQYVAVSMQISSRSTR